MSCGLQVRTQALLQTLASPEWWLVEAVLVVPRIHRLDGFLLLCCNTWKTPKLHYDVLLVSLFYICNWCDWSNDVQSPLGKSCFTQLWRGQHGLLGGNSRWVLTGQPPIKFKVMLWIALESLFQMKHQNLVSYMSFFWVNSRTMAEWKI